MNIHYMQLESTSKHSYSNQRTCLGLTKEHSQTELDLRSPWPCVSQFEVSQSNTKNIPKSSQSCNENIHIVKTVIKLIRDDCLLFRVMHISKLQCVTCCSVHNAAQQF